MRNRRAATSGRGLPHTGLAGARQAGRRPRGYAEWSMRPLYILVFLAPLIALYEYGSVRWLSQPGFEVKLSAQELLGQFFRTFGVVGIHLPAVALVVVLMVMHLMSRDSWRIRPTVPVVMAAESMLWAAPLLVLALLLGRAAAAELGPDAPLERLPLMGRFTVALGAGLYEEMLFRLIGMNLVHALALHLLRTPETQARWLAVVVTAVAFAMLHDLSGLSSGQRIGIRVYLMAAGVFFGVVYLVRGFGIVVGAHAFYDLAVLTLLEREGG
ncbi:MAG: CPBP family intramembrane metalloprotease [Phycisphaeraceae bacterium]|nr:CPBP family intramembrane metalloprotease [Phycisphaeraceae bacterium]